MVEINYLAVIVAAAVQIALGALWYGPFFGKTWTKLMGFSEEHMKAAKAKGMGGSYGFMALGALLMSWVLSIFINSAEAHYGVWSAGFGIHVALYPWFGFVLPLTLTPILWEGKSWKLWFIGISYYFVGLCIMGAILGAWH
jgi:Protein of unknown function (DUF1761)